jgi:hypothetical protein
VVARGGIEPPTRGFSVRRAIANSLNNQSLAALANPHPSLIKAQLRHGQSGVVTPTAIGGRWGQGHYLIEMAKKNMSIAECP